MTRSYQEEVDLRFTKRRYYFEDPNYRKWSDIVPFDSYGYEYLRDDALFCYYLLGHVTSSAYESEQIIEQFEKGLSYLLIGHPFTLILMIYLQTGHHRIVMT